MTADLMLKNARCMLKETEELLQRSRNQRDEIRKHERKRRAEKRLREELVYNAIETTFMYM
jgi:hypothetical protein